MVTLVKIPDVLNVTETWVQIYKRRLIGERLLPAFSEQRDRMYRARLGVPTAPDGPISDTEVLQRQVEDQRELLIGLIETLDEKQMTKLLGHIGVKMAFDCVDDRRS